MNKLPVFGYCRYSSHKQDEGYSIEAQKKAIEKYAKQKNLKVIKWYIDEARRGQDDKRPNFLKLHEDVARKEYKKVKKVLIHKIDRYARNAEMMGKYMRTLTFHGVELVACSQECPNTAEGHFMFNMLVAMAQFYSENLSGEVRKVMIPLARKGLHMGGKPLYGYKVNEMKTYEIVESEAENVRMIFQMYVDNYSLNDILIALKEKSAKTRKNNDFGKNSLTDLIKNEKYIGTYIYNKNSRYQPNGTIDRRKLNDSKDIIRIEDSVPPILSKELFELAQRKRLRNKHGVKQRNSKRTYLLTGKIICGCCGHTMTGNVHINRQNGNKYEYRAYRCNNQQKVKKCSNKEISAIALESFIIEILKRNLFNDYVVDELYESFKSLLETEEISDKEKMSNLKRELSDKKYEKENLMVHLEKGRVIDDIFERIEIKNEEIVEINDRITHLELNKKELISIKEFKQIVRKGKKLLNTDNPKDIHELIEKYIEKIVVSEEDITISFGYQRLVFKHGASDENRTHVVSLEG